MIQERIDMTSKPALPKAVVPRRRLIGGREILLVLIAFCLLAIVPSVAQIGPFAAPQSDPEIVNGLGAAERADANFAGSAFYFLEPGYSVPPVNSADAVAAGIGNIDALTTEAPLDDPSTPYDLPGVGDAARPFILPAGNVAYSRALKCLTDAIYYEAATEADSGQRAVAQVIINRMRHPTYPNSICGVIYQGSERRTGCQFSYSCDGSMARIPSRLHWERARRAAASALAGYVHVPVGMATHYHTVAVNPYWAPSLHFIGTIGAHRFYRWKGSAGRPSAFFRHYAGNEPFPGPKPRAWSPSSPEPALLDPIQLQKQYEREYAAARMKAETDAKKAAAAYAPGALTQYADVTPGRQRAAPAYNAPDYSVEARKRGGDSNYVGEKLPDATNVKAEYQNSGSWKSQPTG